MGSVSNSDEMAYRISTEVDGQATIFSRKEYIKLKDNSNGNYGTNQTVIDTSQLSNSNKYMNYREAYLTVPLLITSGQTGAATAGQFESGLDLSVAPVSGWWNTIHSITCEYNGTTIIQQTPFLNMFNNFKMLTSLSWQDVYTQGSVIGFYPDTAGAFNFHAAADADGHGVCSNRNAGADHANLTADVWWGDKSSNESILINESADNPTLEGLKTQLNQFAEQHGGGKQSNKGMYERQKFMNLVTDANATNTLGEDANVGVKYSQIKNVVSTLFQNRLVKVAGTGAVRGYVQYHVLGIIYLKHLHPFFDNIPLCKGAYLRLTLNLNNSSVTCQYEQAANNATKTLTVTNATNANGGIFPLTVVSQGVGEGGSRRITQITGNAVAANTFITDISVGKTVLNNDLKNNIPLTTGTNHVGDEIELHVPSYTFNAVFEQSYLSDPIATIKYSDYYQYTVQDIGGLQPFNRLITNGVVGLKSVLIIPMYAKSAPGALNGANITGNHVNASIPSFQSPFSQTGRGTCDPLIHLTNFNVVVSGANVLQNNIKYAWEQFIEQTYGVNALNAGMLDGITSGLIDKFGFENQYNYIYIDISTI